MEIRVLILDLVHAHLLPSLPQTGDECRNNPRHTARAPTRPARRSRPSMAPPGPQLVDNRLDERLVRRAPDSGCHVHLPFAPRVTITSVSLKIGVSSWPSVPVNVIVSDAEPALKFQMPVATTWLAEGERRRGDVFGSVGPGGVHRETGDTGDRAEEEVQQVDAVRPQVEEQAAARNRRIEPPDGRSVVGQRLGHRDVN